MCLLVPATQKERLGRGRKRKRKRKEGSTLLEIEMELQGKEHLQQMETEGQGRILPYSLWKVY